MLQTQIADLMKDVSQLRQQVYEKDKLVHPLTFNAVQVNNTYTY